MDAEIPDLVDVYFQPFVRALCNMVDAYQTLQQIFGSPDASQVWQLAGRFQHYDGLFSYRANMIRRERGDDTIATEDGDGAA